MDASKTLVEQERATLKQETARIEHRWTEIERKGVELLDGAQLEADAIIERAWSEARRVIGSDGEATDDAAKLVELRAELEKQRADLDKKRVEHEQNQAQLELERAELVADRAAFDAQVADQGSGEANPTISAALSELEEELARLDAASPEPASIEEPTVQKHQLSQADDPVSALGNWDMLWTEERDESGTPADTELIEPADDSEPSDADTSGEDETPESVETPGSDAAEASETDAAEESEDPEEYGESRYARKSRHLPSIEADHGSPSTGSGLRNAIIGAPGKRGDGS